MKERIAQARKAYDRTPKYGYLRPPTPPTDLQLVTAFFHKDLIALRAIPTDKADERTVRRAQLAGERLSITAFALLQMRHERDAAKVQVEHPRSPSTFEVIARRVQDGNSRIDPDDVGERSHGTFDTFEEARGCVAFDKLVSWEIWQDDHIVAESARPVG
jgi:hypothetical protein